LNISNIMEYKTIRTIGAAVMIGAGIDALASHGGDGYATAAMAEAIVGTGLYLSTYLGEIRDILKTKNTQPSGLETKVDKK